jgi:hypothetical protein
VLTACPRAIAFDVSRKALGRRAALRRMLRSMSSQKRVPEEHPISRIAGIGPVGKRRRPSRAAQPPPANGWIAWRDPIGLHFRAS